MITEIEKKYSFIKSDYQKIIDNCEFKWNENVKDYYLDNSDYILFKNEHYLRLRNWIYELKITEVNKETNLVVSKEIIWDEEIDEILKKDFWITIDETAWVIFVETNREKYIYELDWETINIDIDLFQYWKRYEIEVLSKTKTENEVNGLIEKFREKLWLESIYDESASKVLVSAKNQNIELYEIMINQ